MSCVSALRLLGLAWLLSQRGDCSCDINSNYNACPTSKCNSLNENSFCTNQNSWGCGSCADNYWFKSFDYPCVACDIIDNCDQCSNWEGCTQCADGFHDEWNQDCGFRTCIEDEQIVCDTAFVCPSQCSNNPCNSDELDGNCQVYNEGTGCSQCVNNYFRIGFNYQCTHCQDTFGAACLHCENEHGCQQCSDNYYRLFDENCGSKGIYYCVHSSCLSQTPEVSLVSLPNLPISSAIQVTIDTISVDLNNALASDTIGDINVYINILHTWIGDLTVTLKHVLSDTSVLLHGRCNGGSGLGCRRDNEDIFFDSDELTAAGVCSQCESIGSFARLGTLLPEESLSLFNGLSVISDYELIVTDTIGGDEGTLVEWSISIKPN